MKGLIPSTGRLPSAPMSFYLSLVVWILLAGFLALGVVLATKGSFILLAIGLLAFLLGFVRYGCLGSH
jgi:hypothetical protein